MSAPYCILNQGNDVARHVQVGTNMQHKVKFAVLMLTLGVQVAHAQQESSAIDQSVALNDIVAERLQQELTICHDIRIDSARLSCYDTQSNYVAPAQATSAKSWIFAERSDPVTGKDNSSATLTSDIRHNGRDSPESIVIRCDGVGGYELYIRTSGYIGSTDDRVPVTYRWNDRPPVSERWPESTSGSAAFLPRCYRDFLSGLREGGELAFQWQDYQGSRYASTWSNIRLDENAQYILNGCR